MHIGTRVQSWNHKHITPMNWQISLCSCLAVLLTFPVHAQDTGHIPWYDAEVDAVELISIDELQTFLEQQGATSETASLSQAISTILNESEKLTASDAAFSDRFGFSVSIEADRALIGAWRDDDNGIDSGSAYVFDLVGGVWTETQKLTASDGAPDDFFGFSVSLSGDRALIGSQFDDDNGSDTGSAYVFDLIGGVWTETHKLTASDGDDFDRFGVSVSIEEDRAIIGAWLDDNNGTNAGSAYVFDLAGGVWTETQKLQASDGVANDSFGISVSLSGDRALVGAYFDDDMGSLSGSAYVFDLSGGIWSETQKLTATDGAAQDFFGWAVSLSGDRALIGAYQGTVNTPGSGSAYVYDLIGGIWTETQKLTPSDGAPGDWFGYSVSLSDDRILIGAILDDDNGADSGSAYVFDLAAGVWSETQKLTSTDGASNDLFGWAVSVSGNQALIGAMLDDDTGTDSGSAYVFTFTSSDSDEDGYTDDEEFTCGTDPSDALSFPTGTLTGSITAGSGTQAGITVKALDANNPTIVLGSSTTDNSGLYTIADIAQGDVVVMVVEPLGFAAQSNDFIATVVCNSTTSSLDFTLDALVLTNDIRRASYWKNELDLAAGGGISSEDFTWIIDEIETRFTDPYFTSLYAGVTDVASWQVVFSKRPGTATERANAELGALVMNVMSLKVSQFEVVTADGFTIADVITAASMLLEDGNTANAITAKSWTEQVNRGMTIAAGQIGAGNIAYRRYDNAMSKGSLAGSISLPPPDSIELEGNYPNPFNPQTTIRFAVPEAVHVTVKVYDMLGHLVTTLVEGVEEAGYHEVVFDADKLPSGMYLYRIDSPLGSVSRSMLLIQ